LKHNQSISSFAESTIYHLPITAWPANERPREKLIQYGPAYLTDSELIAILIRTGNKGRTAVDLARNLLSENRTLHEISTYSVNDFKVVGIGESRATAIVAAFELAKRLPEKRFKDQAFIRSPEDIVRAYCNRFKDLLQEELWVFPLNSINKLLEPKQISKGILNSSLAHPRECFREAIKQSAAAVIFVHNHPSGNPEPSQEDIAMTKQLVEAGKIIGITVHDHIIIAADQFTSFAERHLI
jgi:DNA repair protein RadC